MPQARQRAMPAHLVAPRRKVADGQDLQAREQDLRLDTERRTKIFEAENIAAAGAGPGALEPVPDLDKLAAAFAVFCCRVSQVTPNSIFQNCQQKFQLAFDYVISPDQVGVLSRQQKAGIDCFFVRLSSV
jgi:hypothetical protein